MAVTVRRRPLKIMLVEDTPEHADIIMRSLEQLETQSVVTWSKDGSEALKLLFGESDPPYVPDIILLDIKMPRMDGFEVLSVLKNNERLKVVPIVMLSTTTNQDEIFKSYLLGANSYIIKPIGFRELVTVMRDMENYWGHINQKPYQ
jgi:DNA-binding response OmpR family regulator